MTTTTTRERPSSHPEPAGLRRHRAQIAGTVALVALAAAMVANTTFLDPEAAQASGGEKFDAATYAAGNYEAEIVPWIEENAVSATDLATAIGEDLDAAGEEFGGRSGATNAWAFPVTFTGVAGEVNPDNGLLPVEVEGMPEDVDLLVQTGPAMSGSALRDVTGEISFGMFTNQIEFQSVGVQLNEMAKQSVLASLDAASLDGQTVTVTGAFSAGNPAAWIVAPIAFEAGS